MWYRGYKGSLLLQDQEILQCFLFQELLLQLQESQYLGSVTGERRSFGKPFLEPWVLTQGQPTWEGPCSHPSEAVNFLVFIMISNLGRPRDLFMELVKLQIPGGVFPSFPMLTSQSLIWSKRFKYEVPLVFASHFCKCSERKLGTRHELLQPQWV